MLDLLNNCLEQELEENYTAEVGGLLEGRSGLVSPITEVRPQCCNAM